MLGLRPTISDLSSDPSMDPDTVPELSSLGVSEFCEWISNGDHEFPEACLDELRNNGVDGSLFLKLSPEELKN